MELSAHARLTSHTSAMPGRGPSISNRKGPDVAEETKTIQSLAGEEKEVPEAALPFFVNSGWVLLDRAGKPDTKATEKAADAAAKA